MKTAVLGAGAMGSVVGGLLADAGNEVVLVDVAATTVANINSEGLKIETKSGDRQTIQVPATTDPGSLGAMDLVIVFVKCYHTEQAIRNALAIIGPSTSVLSLQNGWGNSTTIGNIIGSERLLVGVSYHSATVLAPGHVLHAGEGNTFIGELDGKESTRLSGVATMFNDAGLKTIPTQSITREIWSKLALNAVTLPTSAAIRISAEKLVRTDEMKQLMSELLRETVAVAAAEKIALNFDERWSAITGVLGRLAENTKGSMLQDVEQRRRTEIDVINGAVINLAQKHGISTPCNRAMFCLIKALENSYE
ncbi:MAG: 2-dehydropantoate 2-reductase [Verrucomicrobia bacterium]|nr:2-dehydropantoate 2-reductase [Verrucomicrobiota bacterium]